GDGLISGTIDGTLTQYYHSDGMGSVRGLSDSSGAMTDSYSYDAYGMLTGSSGASANPYRYRGEQFDSDLDAYYLRARSYQPGTGRFLTTDPVEGMQGDPLSAHRYLYAYNDPIGNLDPSGKITLQEMGESVAIVGLMSAIVSSSFAIAAEIESTGATLADVLPDAGLVGVSLFNVDIRVIDVLDKILGGFSPGYAVLMPKMSVGANLDVIFSLASAQIGVYLSPFVGGSWEVGLSSFEPTLLRASAGDLYHGGIHNLWNVDEYGGWGVGVNVGGGGQTLTLLSSVPASGNFHGVVHPTLDDVAKAFGPSVPSGTAISAGSVVPGGESADLFSIGFSIGLSKRFQQLRLAFESPYDVALYWSATEMALLALAVRNNDPVALFGSITVMSWPMTIAKCKLAWNKHYSRIERDDYSIEKRQSTHNRPPGYRSGSYHLRY
ncbi:MAG: RHS repeat-associated core domain-containing protein, partial [bacterium]|nr:RHS repeat-associated core domain-containing protein [bacterium]